MVVDVEPLEQRLVALEQILQRVEEQTLAKATRTRQEVVLASIHQLPQVGGLIDIVMVLLANLAKSLNPDGQFVLGHRAMRMGLSFGHRTSLQIQRDQNI